ncbi:fatty acid desaturase [Sinimarinibacterium flocculans]|uniref:Fatty acid desaturase n=2 Tax=Sinimarinibacterium flocculans TaxID=985250 RepID=A0A318EK77_9GAMM|nr:fatty acid desaturase [Sinimarinibacterium flocculans]PXV69660.1 fatty acid desaturase [Sinimarinibacterium flocculans]
MSPTPLANSTTAHAAAGAMSDAQKTEHIKAVVLKAGADLRQRHPWLRHQNAIGMGILLASLAGMTGTAWLYLAGHLAWWLCLPVVAIFASFTHELEHDLIHWMYFRKRPLLHHLMMALVWLARPSTINPWIRRTLHFRHHKYSGTEKDAEERGITNGRPWGLARLLMLADATLALLLRVPQAKDRRHRLLLLIGGPIAYFPLGWAFWGLWYVFLGYHGANAVAALAGSEIAWSAATLARMQWLNPLVVVWIGPNVLRSFCLHFVSSNMHYYGDVEDDNVVQQTQVLNPWWLVPFQLFCFNFGATHAIHHFVVKEPFYVRQWTAREAHAVMREMGVRFNDFGSFTRANRWTRAGETAADGLPAAG